MKSTNALGCSLAVATAILGTVSAAPPPGFRPFPQNPMLEGRPGSEFPPVAGDGRGRPFGAPFGTPFGPMPPPGQPLSPTPGSETPATPSDPNLDPAETGAGGADMGTDAGRDSACARIQPAVDRYLKSHPNGELDLAGFLFGFLCLDSDELTNIPTLFTHHRTGPCLRQDGL